MAKRKSYSMESQEGGNVSQLLAPEEFFVYPESGTGRCISVAGLLGKGIDDIVRACHQILWRWHVGALRSAKTIDQRFDSLQHWVVFLSRIAKISRRDLRFSDITYELNDEYISALKSEHTKEGKPKAPSTLRSLWQGVKSLQTELLGLNLIERSPRQFPSNRFPGSNASAKSAQPLTEYEKEALYEHLVRDLHAIKNGSMKVTGSDKLTLYVLFFSIRTGANTTPLLEVRRDALIDHPANPRLKILRLFKRRANKVIKLKLEKPDGDIELETAVSSNFVNLFNEALRDTEGLVKDAPNGRSNRLLLYKSEANSERGLVRSLSDNILSINIRKFLRRWKLLDKRGNPLRVSVPRLRQTFGRDIWKLSEHNLKITAELLGNSESIAASRYSDANDDDLRAFKFAGEILVENMLATPGKKVIPINPDTTKVENTPVAKCRDIKNGRYAPRDGKRPCLNFLYCFRCPDQIITGEKADMHRMFSFYWLIVRERNFIPVRHWKRRYAGVLRIIDRDITPRLPAEAAAAARESARINPHPMWLSRDQLRGEE